MPRWDKTREMVQFETRGWFSSLAKEIQGSVGRVWARSMSVRDIRDDAADFPLSPMLITAALAIRSRFPRTVLLASIGA